MLSPITQSHKLVPVQETKYTDIWMVTVYLDWSNAVTSVNINVAVSLAYPSFDS